MTELAHAYELLTAYAENVQQSETCTEPGRSIQFSRKMVERTLLIAIRRQEMLAPPGGA